MQAKSSLIPTISCSVRGGHLKSESEPEPKIYEVSNLERIQIDVRVTGLDFSPASGCPTVGGLDSDAQGNGLTLVLHARQPGKDESVRTKAFLQGYSYERQRCDSHIYVEIPVDDKQRRKDIDGYLNWLEEVALPRDVEPSKRPEMLGELRRQRTAGKAALERIYLENKEGIFEVSFTLRWRNEPLQIRSITSIPVLVRIVAVGKFFDQPTFRDSPTDSVGRNK